MSERTFDRRLWYSMLGAPTLWLIFLQSAYMLVLFACSKGQKFPLHFLSGVFLTLTLAIGVASWQRWRVTGGHWPSEEGAETDRRGAMAMLGLLQSGLFSMIIITAWAAILILDPCQNVYSP
jgi:hypothetical protein